MERRPGKTIGCCQETGGDGFSVTLRPAGSLVTVSRGVSLCVSPSIIHTKWIFSRAGSSVSSWLGDVIVYIHTSRPRLALRVLLPVVGSYEVRAGEVVVNQWSRDQRTQRHTACDGFNRFTVFRYPWFPIRGNLFASRLEIRSGISRNWGLAVLRDVQTSVYGDPAPGITPRD